MDVEERRRIEAEAFRLMQAQIETMLFALPPGTSVWVGEGRDSFFYRFTS